MTLENPSSKSDYKFNCITGREHLTPQEPNFEPKPPGRNGVSNVISVLWIQNPIIVQQIFEIMIHVKNEHIPTFRILFLNVPERSGILNSI